MWTIARSLDSKTYECRSIDTTISAIEFLSRETDVSNKPPTFDLRSKLKFLARHKKASIFRFCSPTLDIFRNYRPVHVSRRRYASSPGIAHHRVFVPKIPVDTTIPRRGDTRRTINSPRAFSISPEVDRKRRRTSASAHWESVSIRRADVRGSETTDAGRLAKYGGGCRRKEGRAFSLLFVPFVRESAATAELRGKLFDVVLTTRSF